MPAIAWNAIDLFGRGIGIEIDREGLDQRWAIRPSQGVEPGMGIADPAALEPDPDRPVQPAGHGGELVEHRLAQQEALALRGDGPESQLATLIAAVNDGAPAEPGRPLLIPIQDPEELIA